MLDIVKKFLLFCTFLCINNTVFASQVTIQEPFEGPARVNASVVVDAKTRKILHHHNLNTKAYPASLTKMMTIYVAFSEIKRGKLAFNTKMKVSQKAANVSPTKIGLKAAEIISLRDAIDSLIVISANDAAIVIAEHIGKNEERFAKLMTAKAISLGMKDTVFKNPNGLPHRDQVTTAMDMAKLAIALERDFPQYYYLFSQTSFAYNGRKYGTTNKVTATYSHVNGIKTGYTRASGYNLVTSAGKDGRKLVAVILGEDNSASRNQKMVALISKHLNLQSNAFASNSSKTLKQNLSSGKKKKIKS
jgi:D-alanyl-D-alanine carboxypeptidase